MTYRRCDECGRTLTKTEPVVTTTMDFWVFPASDAPEGAEEVIETRTVTLCAKCAEEAEESKR